MPISKELFLAILAMDSYNRGYGAGIADGKGATDANGKDADGLGESGALIGTAIVKDFDLPVGSQAAGFYAVAYDTPYGTVISYRGSDNVAAFSNLNPFSATPGSDAWNGYGVAFGSFEGEQAKLAS